MIKRITIPALLLALGSAAWASGDTDTVRCGNALVEVNESAAKLVEKCGEPTEKIANQWIYDRGPTQMRLIVHIGPNGNIQRMEEVSQNL